MAEEVAAYLVEEWGFSQAAATLSVQMAATFAISTVASRVFAPNVPQIQDNGVRQQVPPDTTTGIPIVYGDAYLGAKFVDAALTTDQKVMYYVMAISCISENGDFTFDTTKFYYGDRLITFDATDKAAVASLTDGAGNVDTKIYGNLKISLFKSDSSGNITNLSGTGVMPWGNGDSVMGPDSGLAVDQQWTSTGRRMNGLAFAIIRLNYSRDAGTTALQPITFRCSQTLNGTGVAKPGDVWYDYITNTVYGGAVADGFVDSDSATALNNYSDELITYTPSGGGSATQPRYRFNGVLDTGQTSLSNIDKIVTCCDSWMQYNAASGQWAIVINKASDPAFYFDDSNIIGSINVGAVDITSSINQIEAKFPDSTNRDQWNYVNLQTPSNLLYPNEPVNKYTITYELVNDSVTSQYLANRILEQNREDLTVNINTTYVGIQVNAGDVISITNSAYGWNNKLFRAMQVKEASLPDGSLGAAIQCIEYSAAVYDDKDITQYVPAGNSEIPSPAYFSGLIPPVVTASYPTATVPTFDVQVKMPDVGRVTYIRLFYSTYSSPTPTQWKLISTYTTSNSQPITNGSYFTFADLSLPSGDYYFGVLVGNEVSQSAVSVPSFIFSWSPTGTAGPTGPRTATGYVYYTLASQTAPSAPSLSGYNFTTGNFSSISANWTTTFTPPNPETNPATEEGSKFWAVRYYVTETTYGGSQSITTSSPFNWQNLDGLVTFTNVTTNSGTTFIDGGNIKAATITANKISTTTLSAITANLGNVTAGTMAIGSGGAISSTIPGFSLSGTTPPAPAVTGGRFYLGSTGYTYMDTPVVYGQLFGSTIGFKAGVTSPDAYFENTTSNANAHGVKAVIPGGSSGYAFYTDQDAYIAGGVLPFTGVHQVLVKENYTLGDIMCDQQLINSNGFSNSIFYVEESTTATQPAIGIFTGLREWGSDSRPYSLQNLTEAEYAQIVAEYMLADVNAVGEGQINVCGENGDIQPGDLIVTSSILGKGMKQADDIVRNVTVAKAREGATFSSSSDIKTIACIYLCG